MPSETFEELLCSVAERGATSALKRVGLHGDDAFDDIREIRSLLIAYRAAKSTMWATFARIITYGIVGILVAGATVKLKIFGN